MTGNVGFIGVHVVGIERACVSTTGIIHPRESTDVAKRALTAIGPAAVGLRAIGSGGGITSVGHHPALAVLPEERAHGLHVHATAEEDNQVAAQDAFPLARR